MGYEISSVRPTIRIPFISGMVETSVNGGMQTVHGTHKTTMLCNQAQDRDCRAVS